MRKLSNDITGSVLLEFALVLPVIFLLFIGSVEFSRSLRVHEMMSFIAREGASEAFRQCGADESSRSCTPDYTAADACLTRVHTEMFGLVQRVVGNTDRFRLVLSTYRYDEDTDSVVPLGHSHDPGNTFTQTMFSEARIRSEFFDLIKEHRVLAIAEVKYDFLPLFNVSYMPARTFYDATIF